MNKKSQQELAGIARDFLKGHGAKIGQRVSLELIARITGHKSLHHAQSLQKKAEAKIPGPIALSTWNPKQTTSVTPAAVNLISDLAAALENSLLHHGNMMTEADRISRSKLVEQAKAFAPEIEITIQKEAEEGITFSDGGFLDRPDKDGTIRRRDSNGNVEEVRKLDDANWEEWANLFNVDARDFRLYRNHYVCSECGTKWDDEWDCMCDDECPHCGATMSPEDSTALDPQTHEPIEGPEQEAATTSVQQRQATLTEQQDARLLKEFIVLLQHRHGAIETMKRVAALPHATGIPTRSGLFELVTDLLAAKRITPASLLRAIDVGIVRCTCFEYDLTYFGGDYSNVGQFAYVPTVIANAVDDKKTAFEWYTTIDKAHVISIENVTYDQEGHSPEKNVELSVGDRVKDSPVGAGEITAFSERGTPKVHGVAVAWLITEAGGKWMFEP